MLNLIRSIFRNRLQERSDAMAEGYRIGKRTTSRSLHNIKWPHPDDSPPVPDAVHSVTIVGSLPATMAGVMAQDLCVTVTQLQRDVFSFMADCDCLATDLIVKLPNRLEGYTRAAFRIPGDTFGNFAPMMVKSILHSKSRDGLEYETEYWFEANGVLCRVIPAGASLLDESLQRRIYSGKWP